MIRTILILGASCGSLFSTKLRMATHDVTLICRRITSPVNPRVQKWAKVITFGGIKPK